MSQVIEVPGVGNVEFPDDMGEHEISHAIQSRIIPQHEQQQQNTQNAESTMAAAAPAVAVPTAMNVAQGAVTGANAVRNAVPVIPEAYQTAKTVAAPLGKSIADLYGQYKNIPKLLTDVTFGHFTGVPPTAVSSLKPGVEDTYKNVMDYLNKRGQFEPSPTTNKIDPAVIAANQQASALDSAKRAAIAKFTEANPHLRLESYQTPIDDFITKHNIPVQTVGTNTGETMGQTAQSLSNRIAPYLQKMSPYLEAGGKALSGAATAYGLGKELFYTSPEEQAQLKQMAQQHATLKDWFNNTGAFQRQQRNQAIEDVAAQRAGINLNQPAGPIAPGQ